jgi:hypothetical protein
MPDRLLRHGDSGPDVAVAQDLLNRNGALLDADGQFGGGTEAAVRDCQQQASLPVTGQIDTTTWLLLRQLPEPLPEIGTRSVTFIAQKEVSSRAYYDSVETRPSYPGLTSGITIGIGYDLHYEKNFAVDWHGLLPPAVLAALAPYVGRQGTHDTVNELGNMRVPWFAAWTVFVHRSLPTYLATTRTAFPALEGLSPLCRGMLVSLVYNRGSNMDG